MGPYFTSTLINEFRLGFVRNASYGVQDPFGLNHTAGYIPGVPENPAMDGGVSQTTFSNSGFIGSPDFLPKFQTPQQWQYVDTVSLTRGNHSFKFGMDACAPMRNIFQDEPGAQGSLSFSGQFTGLSYADALVGYVQGAQLTNVFFVDQRLFMASVFAQDDWKLTPHLALNLGLRYDFGSPAYEGRNRMANFDPAGNSGAGALVFAQSGSLEDRALVNVNTRNFAPRFGFLFAGRQDCHPRRLRNLLQSLGAVRQRKPARSELSRSSQRSCGGTEQHSAGILAPERLSFELPGPLASAGFPSARARSGHPYDPTPYVQQWSFGLQRDLGFGLVAEADYVGTKSTHLDVLSDYNQHFQGAPAPFPAFDYIEYTSSLGNGTYHGFETALTKRFSSGISTRVTYTWSHAIDNAPDELNSNSGALPNGRNFAAWHGPADFDTPHRVVANFLYELPFGKGKHWLNSGLASYLLGDWRVSGVYTFASGRPYTVSLGAPFSTNIDPYGAATAVPNVMSTPITVGDVDCWFYVSRNKTCRAIEGALPDAFANPVLGTFGNAGRNILRGPHTSVLDASLMKNIPIGERFNAQLRWEVFNVGNQVLLGQPNSTLTSGAVGQITSLARDQRVMQFALRLSF